MGKASVILRETTARLLENEIAGVGMNAFEKGLRLNGRGA